MAPILSRPANGYTLQPVSGVRANPQATGARRSPVAAWVRPPLTHSSTMVPSYFLLAQTQKPSGVVVEDIALLRW